MNELQANADSVNFLITKLCESIAHSNGLQYSNVKKLKSSAFEVLLMKRDCHQPGSCDDDGFDPLTALDVQIFSAKMNASKRQLRELENFTKLEHELNGIMRETDDTTNDTCKRLVQLLLALQGNICGDEEPSPYRKLLVPGPFTLHGTYTKNPYYPFGSNEILFNGGPQYFKGVEAFKIENNPYMPRFLKQPHRYDKKADNLQERSGTTKCSFTGMTARLCGIKKATPAIASGPFNIFTRFMNLNKKALKEDGPNEGEASKPVTTQPVPEERVPMFSWESLGYCDAAKPLPFATEANVVLHLMSHHLSRQDKQFKAQIVSSEQFMADLKSLTVGIQSDTFQCDDLMIFHMVPHVTVSDILPATIENFVVDFLECGTCFRRLRTMIMKRDYQLMFEGLIFKALCQAIDEYLLTMRQFVSGYQDSYLTGYYRRVKKMMKQTVNLSLTLGIHPSVEDDVQPPLGSQFLGYIYREIVHLTDMDYITLLMYILRRCCHVYFKHLQKWVFHGVLDDPSNELFICFVDNYRQFTKYHYDKAYYVRQESVPGFLQNYENQLLKCGKYTMLLKAWKPNHPLLELECPSIAVCVSFEEIQRLEQDCLKYYHRAIEVCGKPLTVRALFQSRAEQKAKFRAMNTEKWRINLERWAEEERLMEQQRNEIREKRLEGLQQQLVEMNTRKVAERRANVERELLHLRELEKLEDKRLLVENINLRKRIEYYQELSDTLREEAGEPIIPPVLRLVIPVAEEASRNPSPRSPCSNTDTEFESCHGGEDDAASTEYLDCLTRSKSTQSLERAISSSVPLKRSASDVINSNVENKPPATVSSARASAMVRTESSENAVPLMAFEEAKRNKMKVMAHEYGMLRDSVRTKSMPDINLNNVPDDQLTDLQRNRRRAMQDTWQTGDGADTQPQPQKAQLSLELETNLQRNRRQVLESEYDILTGERTTPGQALGPDTPMSTTSDTASDPQPQRAQLTLELETDLERNRRKVLESEYDLITGQRTTPGEALSPDTPMSTTSDTPLTESTTKHPSDARPQKAQLTLELETDLERNRRKVLESEFDIVTGQRTTPGQESAQPSDADTQPQRAQLPLESDLERNRRKVLESEYDLMTGLRTTPGHELARDAALLLDEENGNLVEKPSTTTFNIPNIEDGEKLKLNVELAGGDAKNVPNTGETDDQPTPESALNTAGLMAKQGFQFGAVAESRHDGLTLDSDLNPKASESSHSDPYDRCVELLRSDFKCPPLSRFIRLNKTTKVPEKENFSGIVQTIDSQRRDHRTPLTSVSVIALTDFLQKSVIIPMHTHLELVNNEVMRMFLDDLDIVRHMRSLRKYFLLMDGEFGAIICDGIIGQLEGGEAPQKLLNYQVLHSILDAALVSSRAGQDRNADHLSFIVSDVPEEFDLSCPKVLDVLSLSYAVEWPLNLILNPDTLARYATVFRYLMQVRRISWVLERSYQLLKEAVKQHGSDLHKSPQFRHVELIRHKFYHFVHALSNHITANALEASWKQFKDDLMGAMCIEDIYRKHTDYMKRIMFLCMLNRKSADFYNNIENIFKISLRFYNNLKSRPFVQKSGDEYFSHARYGKIVADEMEFDKFIKFAIYLGNKIVKHGYQEEIGEFISLINYNYYYAPK